MFWKGFSNDLKDIKMQFSLFFVLVTLLAVAKCVCIPGYFYI